MGGGLESRCVGRVYGKDGALHNECVHVFHFSPNIIRVIKS